MSTGDVVNLMRISITEVVMLSGPVLIVALVIGLVISIFQATTSIQDQTLTFVPKILAIFGTIAILAGWMFSQMSSFTVNLFSAISSIG
ncbi:MAG: flagellar biosynthesis protein FliQ [Spirochaetales bacterium]|nr:flagellar biosynthesis protein FliQ [Spirochaetales bacterium]